MSDDELRATHRILDASANRAGEGLRTLEEYARFVLDDAGMTSELKSLRHDLAAALAEFPRSLLLAARDTGGDVGTAIGQPSEYNRSTAADVVAAAAPRTQQALRVLEEYGKSIAPNVAASIEQIRYRCYTVTAALELQTTIHARRRRLADAQLYVLIDAGPSDEAFAQQVRLLAENGVDVIQLRDREHDDRTLYERSKAGARIARDFDSLFIVNDRADLAAAVDADGVHVGQDELPAAAARQIVGADRLVGVSTHSIVQARQAVVDGADYIGCGPVFAGQTKTFDSYVGTSLLREVTAEIKIPAFAIGGIMLANLPEVAAAGFARIAVSGAIRNAADPAEAIVELKKLLAATSEAIVRG